MNEGLYDEERKDFSCTVNGCNGIANCGQSDYDMCWYGPCRACGTLLIIAPEGRKPGRGLNYCTTCED